MSYMKKVNAARRPEKNLSVVVDIPTLILVKTDGTVLAEPMGDAVERVVDGLLGTHVTPSNPSGSVQQCTRRDIHEGHEWQAGFGAYFNVYCPGNDGTKR